MQLTAHIYTQVGDITLQCTDAIVNAANSSLLGGGGVDGAIHRAGGSAILEACREIRRSRYPDGLPTGEAVATTAGEICARYVIHTVGPVYGSCGSACAELLGNCYTNALLLARELDCKSIAFPAISTGIYGYPADEAARIAFARLSAFTEQYPMEVVLVFHSQHNEVRFLEAIR